MLTGSLNVLLLYLTGESIHLILHVASASGNPACNTGPNGIGVTVFLKICSLVMFFQPCPVYPI